MYERRKLTFDSIMNKRCINAIISVEVLIDRFIYYVVLLVAVMKDDKKDKQLYYN